MTAVSDAHVKLSKSFTIARYLEVEKKEDRDCAGTFVRERFDERYFEPVLSPGNRHGFTMLAVGCLVLETLESFYQGRPDTKHESRKMFAAFFARNTELRVFGRGKADWFFLDIRCGILHQSETRGGWRIWRKGPLLDETNRTINAQEFIKALQRCVDSYATELCTDDPLWAKFKVKMAAICGNARP
jgi:hypothetical protein